MNPLFRACRAGANIIVRYLGCLSRQSTTYPRPGVTFPTAGGTRVPNTHVLTRGTPHYRSGGAIPEFARLDHDEIDQCIVIQVHFGGGYEETTLYAHDPKRRSTKLAVHPLNLFQYLLATESTTN